MMCGCRHQRREKQEKYLRVREGTSLCGDGGGGSCGEDKLSVDESKPRVSGPL